MAQSLAIALPRGRLVLLDGAQPVLFTEHPDEIVSLLTSFFRAGVTGGNGIIAARSAAIRSDGAHSRWRRNRVFTVATHPATWALKSAGEANSRPGRNDRSR